MNHIIAFRITPDISRETGSGSSLNGSMVFRLKYGYAQINLDDWLWRGSSVRAGMIQTPLVDFEESVYRYRFQGPTFTDREGCLTSADVGVSFRTQFPGERRRLASLITYEHRFVNAGYLYLDAADRTSRTAARADAVGHSLWFTPRLLLGPAQTTPPTPGTRPSLEGLFRYDRLEPNRASRSVKTRTIAGVAYWPRMATASLTSAVLLDLEQVRYRNYMPSRQTERRLTVHLLLQF
jgi:hypothetical protein